MSVTVRIPTQLRASLGRRRRGLGRRARTVADVLQDLEAKHAGFTERLFDDQGELRRFVNVFVADEDIRFLDGVNTSVATGRPSASSRRSPGADLDRPDDQAGRA